MEKIDAFTILSDILVSNRRQMIAVWPSQVRTLMLPPMPERAARFCFTLHAALRPVSASRTATVNDSRITDFTINE